MVYILHSRSCFPSLHLIDVYRSLLSSFLLHVIYMYICSLFFFTVYFISLIETELPSGKRHHRATCVLYEEFSATLYFVIFHLHLIIQDKIRCLSNFIWELKLNCPRHNLWIKNLITYISKFIFYFINKIKTVT